MKGGDSSGQCFPQQPLLAHVNFRVQKRGRKLPISALLHWSPCKCVWGEAQGTSTSIKHIQASRPVRPLGATISSHPMCLFPSKQTIKLLLLRPLGSRSGFRASQHGGYHSVLTDPKPPLFLDSLSYHTPLSSTGF